MSVAVLPEVFTLVVVVTVLTLGAVSGVRGGEDGSRDRRLRRELPGTATVTGPGEVVHHADVWGQVATGEDAVPGVAEGNAEPTSRRERSGVHAGDRRGRGAPGLPAIGAEEDPGRPQTLGDEGRGRHPGGDPRPSMPLGRDARPARGETRLAGKRGGKVVSVVVPGLPVEGLDRGEAAIHGVGEVHPRRRVPEGEADVELVGGRLELELPGLPAVRRLVDPRGDERVGGARGNGEEVGDLLAHRLDIAKLHDLRAG